MEFRDYARVLRAHWLLLVLSTLCGIALAIAFVVVQRPVYESTARVFVSTSSATSVADLSTGATLTEQLVKSYAAVATSPYVLREVIRDLGLAETPAQLAQAVTATASSDTVVIEITAQDHSAARAAAIANAVSSRLSSAVAGLTHATGAAASPIQLTTIQPATAARLPSSPDIPIDLALGLLVGLVLGAGLLVLREALDTRIRALDALKRVTGMPVLASLPTDGSTVRRPLATTAGGGRSARAEAVRTLVTNLEYSGLEDRPTIVVTSSVACEGKTTTAANLAVALTEAGRSVVVVDADMRRPSLADAFGVDGGLGLSDVLAGRTDLQSALQSWGENGLAVLPAGHLPPNPYELLRSDAMAELLTELSNRYSTVVIDTPPVLVAADAPLLAARASATLMVAAMRFVTRPQLSAALEQLALLEVRVVGVVANRVAKRESAYGYEYSAATAPTASGNQRRARKAARAARQLKPKSAA